MSRAVKVTGGLLLAMLVVTWFSAILSMVVANIPFTAAMLTVVGYLAATSRKLDTPLAVVIQSSSAAGRFRVGLIILREQPEVDPSSARSGLAISISVRCSPQSGAAATRSQYGYLRQGPDQLSPGLSGP